MEANPDFYLSCNGVESDCRLVGRTVALGRDDLLVARVAPAIHAPIGDAALDEVILAPRQPGASLLPLPSSPTPVYVCQLQRSASGATQLAVVAWGELRQRPEI